MVCRLIDQSFCSIKQLSSSVFANQAFGMQDSGRVVVVTGAGCSTESNIPDYRGPNGAYNTGFKPMTHQQVALDDKQLDV